MSHPKSSGSLEGESQELYIQELEKQLAESRAEIQHLQAAAKEISAPAQTLQALSYQSLLLENIHDAVVGTDPNFVITYWNKAAEELYGWTAEEAVGRDLKSIMFCGLVGEQRELVLQSLVERGPLTMELVQRGKGGREFVVEATGIAISDPGGQLQGWVAAVRDITAREHALAELKGSEAEFRAIFELASEGIAENDLQTMRFIRANRRFCEMVGYTEAELKQLTFGEITHPEDFATEIVRYQAFLESGADEWEVEKRYLHKTGTVVWVRIAGTIVRDEQGKPTRSYAVIQDITGNKLAVQSLRESEEKFSKAFYTSPNFLFICELESGHFLEVNDAFCALTGYDRPDLIGRNSVEIGIFSPEHREKIRQQILSAQKLQNLEAQFKTRTGETKTAILSAQILTYGGQTCILGSGIDITRRKEAERALRENEERLRLINQVAKIGTWEWQPDWDYSQNDELFFQIHGLEPTPDGRVILGPYLERVHPEDRERLYEAVIQAARGETTLDRPFRFFSPDGSVRWIQSYRKNIYENERLVRQIGAVRDITEQVHYEENLRAANQALRESEALFSALFRASPVPLAMYELTSGRFTEVNEAFAGLFGYERDELAGITLADLQVILSDEDLQYLADQIQKADMIKNHQIEILHKDGQSRHILFSAVRLNLAGKPVVLSGITDITDLQHARESLQASEEKFRTLATNMAQLAWMADEGGQIFWYNQRWYDYTGTSFADMDRSGWQAVLHPEHVERVVEKMENSAATGSSWEDTFPLRGADSQYRWFLSRAIPICDEAGKVLRWLGTNTDITEQRAVEEALRKSENRLRTILEHLPVGVWLVDENGRLLYGNLAALRIWGRSGYDELERFPDYKGWWPESGQKVEPDEWPMARALQKGETILNEIIRIESFDGQPKIVQFAAVPIWGEKCKLQGVVVVQEDITKRREAEQALQQSESRLRRLVDANLIGVLFQNETGQVWEANQAFLDLVGYSRDELQAGQINSSDITASEFRAHDRHGMAEARARGACTPYEKEYLRKDGTRLPVLVGFAQLEESQSDFVAFILDLSELKQAQEVLKDYAAMLERSNKELQEFAFVASHDLQEPLRKVKGFGESLYQQLSGKLTEEENMQFGRMLNASTRMQSMIHALLELSRVTTQGRPFQPVHLSDIVEDVISDLELTISRTDARVEMAELPTINADAHQMHSLFLNLINNALKYHREDVPPEVKVSARLLGIMPEEAKLFGKRMSTIPSIHIANAIRSKEAGELLEVTVSDNGIGFDMKYLERIFQPFQRLHGRSRYEGTGMGLAICKKIVERHGGSLTARSIPGEGSTFIVILPLEQPA